MNIVRVRLGKKDQLLKVWYKTMRDSGDSISLATVFIIRYYIKTGQYLDAACLKAETKELPDDIKGIIVPEQSDVGVWLTTKAAEGMKKSALIKRILRSSIHYETPGEQLFLLDTDKLFQYSEHPEVVPAKQEMYKIPPVMQNEHVSEIGIKKEQSEPIRQTVEQDITPPEPISEPPHRGVYEEEETSNAEPAQPKENRPKKRNNTLFDNLVTTGLRR